MSFKKLKATRILGGALGLLLTLSLVLVPAPALAVPASGHVFYGNVTSEGVPVDVGTTIDARVSGGLEYTTQTIDAEGSYGLLVESDDQEIPGKDGAYAGDLIEFYVEEVLANTYAFEIQGATELDLTVGEVPTQYTLDVDTVGSGSVTKDPDQVTYTYGDVVQLTAVPDTGWSFDGWSGDLTGTTNPDSITMDGNKAVTATFAEVAVTYDLTVASSAGGSVTTPGEPGPFTYEPTTVVDLVAVPETDYEFVSWTGEVGTVGNVNEASTTITMNGNYSITANFGEIGVTYDLTVASTAGGSVTDPGEPGPFNYPDGTPVDLLAVADTGYLFDNWTGDVSTIANVNAASTTITMDADYSITANFAEVTGDLEEMIAGTPSGGTLLLPAGTYTGDVTINQPITIIGTVGTIVSGGIHIVPLVGSNVTLEYLTITDYTGYGIWIELVDTGDVFTIRNNTIEGVEGSVIGIQVDEVVTGGSLLITQNSISHNDVGVKLLEDVADGGIQFNDITGNTIGLEQLAEVIGAYAVQNWWGDISGPGEENENPGGIGDNVTGNIGYYPWLTRDFQTVLDDNIAYFGLPAVGVDTGWNIISTPIALDPACDTWGEYVALGDGLSTDNTSPAYRFDAQTQAWVALSSDDTLEPCDAIYVRMAEPDVAAILYSPNVSVPAKQLYSGWNLVSLAWLPSTMEDVYGLPADEALVSVAEVPGGLNGYVLVVSPSVNPYEGSWIYTAGQSIEPWTDPNVWPPPDGYMLIASGYWVFMLNDGTLAGFTFTPVSLSLPPAPPEGG